MKSRGPVGVLSPRDRRFGLLEIRLAVKGAESALEGGVVHAHPHLDIAYVDAGIGCFIGDFDNGFQHG